MLPLRLTLRDRGQSIMIHFRYFTEQLQTLIRDHQVRPSHQILRIVHEPESNAGWLICLDLDLPVLLTCATSSFFFLRVRGYFFSRSRKYLGDLSELLGVDDWLILGLNRFVRPINRFEKGLKSASGLWLRFEIYKDHSFANMSSHLLKPSLSKLTKIDTEGTNLSSLHRPHTHLFTEDALDFHYLKPSICIRSQ